MGPIDAGELNACKFGPVAYQLSISIERMIP